MDNGKKIDINCRLIILIRQAAGIGGVENFPRHHRKLELEHR